MKDDERNIETSRQLSSPPVGEMSCGSTAVEVVYVHLCIAGCLPICPLQYVCEQMMEMLGGM